MPHEQSAEDNPDIPVPASSAEQTPTVEAAVDPETEVRTLSTEQLVEVFNRGLFLMEERGKEGTVMVNRHHGTVYRLDQLKDGGITLRQYLIRSGWAATGNSPDAYNATFYDDGRVIDHIGEEKGNPRGIYDTVSAVAERPMEVYDVEEHFSEIEAGDETGITIPGVPGFFSSVEEADRYRHWKDERKAHYPR